MKVVIVGGVAGGATAAARIRRLNEKADIIIFEKTNYVSYANCGLPYYIGDEIKNKKNLTLATPESLWNRYRIKVNVKHEVININPSNKTVIVKNLEDDSIFEECYDKLLLSPGANPITLNLLDKPLKNVFTLKNVEDSFKIKEYITFTKPNNVAIIGGGFIGVEMAENLQRLGINVSIFQKDYQLLNNVDHDIASFMHHHIRSKGVNVFLNTTIEKIGNDDTKVVVEVNDSKLQFDMAILCIGVTPNNELAKKAGLLLSENGSIVVDNKMQTNIPDIYAVGDAVEITHNVLNKKMLIPLAGPANKQARVAADNICGIDSEYKGSLGSSVIKVFDLTVASVGITETVCKKYNFKYEKVFLSQASHATYYPGASPLSLKVIYEKETNKILGAQAVGYEEVEKRIDVIAAVMFAGGNALILKDLDLTYAPPYSSAKDPVNMAGFIIDNIENGLVKQFDFDDIKYLRLQDDVILLDTRTVNEYMMGHADGFINIPLDELRDNLHLLNKDKKIYVMCQSGLRSYLSSRILMENGFDAYNFIGGYKLYSSLSSDN